MSLMMGYIRILFASVRQESQHIWPQKMLGTSCFCLLPFSSPENFGESPLLFYLEKKEGLI
jgi:hypothetical protein